MAGELLVAKIRLMLSVVILTIPVLAALTQPVEKDEGLVGFSLICATFVFSAIVYLLINREFNPPWLSFVSSAYDVSLVSAGLAVFLLLNQPHTAVNSKVVFEGYFLAIGSTSLRYDQRVCITAGLLAMGEYFAIVAYAAHKWDLNSAAFSPFPYGMFSWTTEVSRLILMLTAVALSIALVSRTQSLLRLATSDPLTTLFNRGYVDDRFAIELSRARRYNQPLTVAMIDVDNFKSFNDDHGHAAGDLVLRQIADTLRHSFRQSDTTGRYGGEEFVVIMPETDIDAAHRKLESVREKIAGTPIKLIKPGDSATVTISVGLAAFPDHGTNEAEVLATADGRLFEAKREGRNRVVASGPVLV